MRFTIATFDSDDGHQYFVEYHRKAGSAKLRKCMNSKIQENLNLQQ